MVCRSRLLSPCINKCSVCCSTLLTRHLCAFAHWVLLLASVPVSFSCSTISTLEVIFYGFPSAGVCVPVLLEIPCKSLGLPQPSLLEQRIAKAISVFALLGFDSDY